MKFDPAETLGSIAALIGCEFEGPEDFPITGLNEIHTVEEGDIVFVDHEKYYEKALNCAATTILINKKVVCPNGKALVFSESPFDDFNRLIARFSQFEPATDMIHESAIVGRGTVLQPGVFVGKGTTIGENCVVHPNVVIYGPASIGNNVVIHANCTIGADAFYYQRKEEGHNKFVSCGRVVIEDDVEIGAGSTIDRGVTGDTRIGKGTKLDNLVMIGHDCTVGRHCIFAAQVGLAGTVTVEDNVVLWGQVGAATGITVGKGAVVLAQSGLSKDAEGGKTYFGYPAAEARVKMRELASTRKLPKIIRELGR